MKIIERVLLTFLAILSLLLSNLALAEDHKEDKESFYQSSDTYSWRGDIWRPVLNLGLPGLDQLIIEQYAWGIGYSTVAVSSYIWHQDASRRDRAYKDGPNYVTDADKINYNFRHPLSQEEIFSDKLRLSTSYMSAYHSFRTAVKSRRPYGQYGFLDPKNVETPQNILLAPFRFSYLKRPTTWIYLLVDAAMVYAGYDAALKEDDVVPAPYTGFDASFSFVGGSFLAGTSEEALYRGYYLPVFYEYTGSFWLANALQSAIFTVSHRQGTSPYPRLFANAAYWGWLSKRNGWRIGEGIFIHTWGNFISQFAVLSLRKEETRLMLPAVNVIF